MGKKNQFRRLQSSFHGSNPRNNGSVTRDPCYSAHKIWKQSDINGNHSYSIQGRYFNEGCKASDHSWQSSSSSLHLSNSTASSTKNDRKMGKKRKILPDRAPDYLSLDTSEPVQKIIRLSSDDESDEFGSVPFSQREARKLFEKDPFSEQMNQFFRKNQQREEFLNKKLQLKSALQKAISYSAIEGAKLSLVGSSVNGFGRITSDADFCLIIDETSENIKERRRIMDALNQVRRLLRLAPFVRNLQLIPAQVPILKFMDCYSGMECDLNVNNLTGVRNTELMKRYSMLDPRVQPLVLIVKEWAHQSYINDASKGTLNSYSIVLMVIHFLQCGTSPAVIPSLQVEHPDLFKTSIPIQQISLRANRVKSYRSRNTSTLSQLLRQFFQYFVEKFNFRTDIMSVRLGKVIDVYSSVHSADWLKKQIKIEEPFDLSNTARAVYNRQKADEIFKKFEQAHARMQRQNGLHCLLNGVPPMRSRDSVIILDD